MKSQLSRIDRQGGFSAIEMIAVLAAMALISGIAVFSYDQSNSRGIALSSAMNDYANAMLMAKNDFSCYPTRMDVLFDPTKANADNSFCGLDISAQWHQRYAQPAPVDSSGNIIISNIGAGATLGITQSQDSIGTHWRITASNIPNEVLPKALTACNGARQSAGRCVAAEGSSGNGTLTLEFDLT